MHLFCNSPWILHDIHLKTQPLQVNGTSYLPFVTIRTLRISWHLNTSLLVKEASNNREIHLRVNLNLQLFLTFVAQPLPEETVLVNRVWWPYQLLYVCGKYHNVPLLLLSGTSFVSCTNTFPPNHCHPSFIITIQGHSVHIFVCSVES